jgi:hypothetical protein
VASVRANSDADLCDHHPVTDNHFKEGAADLRGELLCVSKRIVISFTKAESVDSSLYSALVEYIHCLRDQDC